MLYPEYKYHEMAYIYGFNEDGRALFSRNKIVTGKEVKKYYGETDYFVSAARYDESLPEYIKNSEKGKIRGFDGNIWYDFIIIDIDEIDPRKIGVFMQHLEINYGIQIDYCRMYFSGSKGFHVLIPTPIFGLKPSDQLHAIVKDLVHKIADNILMYDTSLYDKVQIYRLPHTKHSSTGAYKVPLYYEELSKGLDYIRRISEKQRLDFNYPEYPTETVPELAELVVTERKKKRKRKKIIAPGSVQDELDNIPPFRKLCILHMLKGVPEGERGGRDETAIRIASHFRKERYGFEVVLGLLHGWNSLNTPPMADSEIRAKVISVFQGKSDYGCKDPVMLISCDPNCHLFRS
jgi:hypothetical protein